MSLGMNEYSEPVSLGGFINGVNQNSSPLGSPRSGLTGLSGSNKLSSPDLNTSYRKSSNLGGISPRASPDSPRGYDSLDNILGSPNSPGLKDASALADSMQRGYNSLGSPRMSLDSPRGYDSLDNILGSPRASPRMSLNSPGLKDASALAESSTRYNSLERSPTMDSPTGSSYMSPQLNDALKELEETVDNKPISQYPIGLSSPPRQSGALLSMMHTYDKDFSSKEKLKSFWENASKDSRISTDCYLDGRYFNKVLMPYEGLVTEPLYIGIEEGEYTEDTNDGDMREFDMRMSFDTAALRKSSGPIRLIRVIIETGQVGYQGIFRHSNLVWIDTESKEIYRFEPIKMHPYSGPINTAMQEYFEEILPEYTFMQWDEAPQMLESPVCPGRGMCSAYVLMLAMKLITGKAYSNPFPENHMEAEKQIMRFAHSIKHQFGEIPGTPDLDYGFFDNWGQSRWNPKNWTTGQKALGGAAVGALAGGLLLGGWKGALFGGLAGGAGGYLLGKSGSNQNRYATQPYGYNPYRRY